MDSAEKPTILVVDDEQSMRDFLGSVLEQEGYATRLVGDGDAALAELRAGGIQVVVMDMRMPGMSGYELLCRVREEWPSAGVIIISGYPSEEAVIRAMSLGAVRFLVKPFKVPEFLRALAGALHDIRDAEVMRESIAVQGGVRDWIELTAPSRQEYLERLDNFVAALSSSRLGSSEQEDLRIAVNEVAANAMEWGNQRDDRRRISVSYCLFPEEIVIKVADEGEGFRPEEVPDPSGNPVANIIERVKEGKRVGGYGMFIARQVMDKVVYSEKGNVVVLSKSLAAPPAASGERGSDSHA
jgi:DNA-binding response OmpR family regulator